MRSAAAWPPLEETPGLCQAEMQTACKTGRSAHAPRQKPRSGLGWWVGASERASMSLPWPKGGHKALREQ